MLSKPTKDGKNPMCELLVIIETGDVLAVFPDNHAFGGMELTNPAWRVVKVPGVVETDVGDLTSIGAASSLHGPRAFRLFYLNPQMLGETLSLETLRSIQTRRDTR